MNTNRLRMPLDILMTLLSIILMGGTVLFPDDRIHQVLGIALLALWAVHITLNHRWYSSIFKGKYNARRIMQTIVNCGILICALLLMISGMMMAWFVPSEIVGGGLGFARTTHLLSSHWYYIFMSFHIGLHAAMIASKMKIHGIVPRVICILISLYGVYAFIVRGLWKYMFGLQQFFFFDFEKGYVLFALDYVSIIVLFGTVSYYIGTLLARGQK
ncbi:MAG: DUF4405 domain-containing protein [Treponema sp.]|nr:DUF4405 domain-containing protein [Treponema sp.]